MATARSAYALRVYAREEPSRQWLLGAVSGILAAGDPSFGTQRARVEIVSERGTFLVGWTLTPRESDDLARKIESDLDRLDAESFADEWGIE